MNIESTLVAFFQHFAASGKNVPLCKMLDGIKNGAWAGQIKRLRTKEKGTPDHDKIKGRLPAFMLSCTTNGGRITADVKAHSGLLQIDIDDVGAEHARDIRDRIGEDRHIFAAWLSPSGDGVKGIMLIPADVARHKSAFEAAADYMRETYAVTIDPQCSNVNRPCFVSHDPELVLNADAVPLEVKQRLCDLSPPITGEDSSESLSPVSCVLSNNSLFVEFPDLKPLYFKLVEGRIGKPQRGERNGAMVELVATCFCVVSPEFVIAFAKEFFTRHAAAFEDYGFDTYQREVHAMLEGCQRSYPERLSEPERQAYTALDNERERAIFRIARSLSKCETHATMPPLFFLSCDELRKRIKCFKMEAWRILRACCWWCSYCAEIWRTISCAIICAASSDPSAQYARCEFMPSCARHEASLSVWCLNFSK